jgi:hypothetical protein
LSSITATSQHKKSTINYKKQKMAVKRMAEVWQRPPEDDGNAMTATATATAVTTAMEMTAAGT